MKLKRSVRFGCSVGGSNRGGMRKAREYIKDEWVGKRVSINPNNRTMVVRLFMRALKPINTPQQAKQVSAFLKRFGLSKTEKATIIFHLGYRYSAEYYRWKYGNMQIDGVYDFCKDKKQHPENKEKHRVYMRAYYQRPEVKEKIRAYHQRPEVKQRQRQYMREYRKKNDAVTPFPKTG